MSPAVSEMSSTNSPSPARKARKGKEASNRVVTNLPRDYTWLVRRDAAALGFVPSQMVRMLVTEAYRARGMNPKQVKATYLIYMATIAQAEADAEAALAVAEAEADTSVAS